MNKLMLKGMTTVCGIQIPHIAGGFGSDKKGMLVRDIAQMHERELKDVNRLVNNNRVRFKDGVDIIDLKVGDFKSLTLRMDYTNQSYANSDNIYLLSERGYSKLIKIMDDDLSWEIYDKILDEYFEMKKEGSGDKSSVLKEVTNAIKLISDPNIRDRAMTAALEEILGIDLSQEHEQVENQKVIDPIMKQFTEECLVTDFNGQISNKRLTEIYNAWSNNKYSTANFSILFTPSGINMGFKKIKNYHHSRTWIGIREK